MPSNTDRMGLMVHTLGDKFRIQDYADNWQLLDDFPGIYICTSSTRPTWDVNQEGMTIYEVDTHLYWTWSGSAWERWIAQGWIGGDEVNSDVATSSTTYVEAISVEVEVADGGRRHLITVHAPGVYSTEGLTELALYRDATLLQEWYSQGWTGGTPESYPRPIFVAVPDTPGAGTRDYTLQVKANTTLGGTSTISASATKPIALDVFEM